MRLLMIGKLMLAKKALPVDHLVVLVLQEVGGPHVWVVDVCGII